MTNQELLEKAGGQNDSRFEVGKAFPLPLDPGEGVSFSVEPFTMLLIYRFNRPSQEEIKEFREGRVELAVTRLRSVLFFLSRFGRLSWSDAPYSTHLTEREKELPDIGESHRGYSVDAFLVDAHDKTLVAHRLVRMTPEFSRKFKETLRKDWEDGMDLSRFNKAVGDVYANFSTKDLLGFCDAQMKEDKE